jgi:hypothetical protein
MTSADTEAMAVLEELLDERQRYEGWIVALEQRESATAPHVYSRVYTDYTLRLERVLQRLSERTEQLQSTMQLMASRLAALRSREADRIDVRQEAELRASVGEYGDEEWATMRDDADREIALIAEERRGVEVEFAEIERIVEMTRISQVATTEASATEANGGASVVERKASVSENAPQMPQSIHDFVAERPARLVESIPPMGASLEVHETVQSRTALSLNIPPIQPDTPVSPAVESRKEQEKTLKCPECGGLNYATEWYCERCGGELATF